MPIALTCVCSLVLFIKTSQSCTDRCIGGRSEIIIQYFSDYVCVVILKALFGKGASHLSFVAKCYNDYLFKSQACFKCVLKV